MIEKWIKNEETLKRIKRFKSQKRAHWSFWIFIGLILLSLTAEFWANDKPILLNYDGKVYAPLLKNYHPTNFDRDDIFYMDYKELNSSDKLKWAWWPIIRWSPFESNLEAPEFPAPPSKANLFGTDDRGRDVLTRLIYGFRYSIGYGLLVWFFAFFMGTILGAIMGYYGGWTDLIGQRMVEVFGSMPQLLLLITLSSIFKPGLLLLVIFSSLFGWMMISLYIRGEFLKLRKLEFIEAARASGLNKNLIMLKHVLPNSLVPIVTFSPFAIAAGISSLASLDYLGFGLQPPTPSWGELLNQAMSNFTIAWWLAVFPSLALFITMTSLNFMGEGVRDAFDPKKG